MPRKHYMFYTQGYISMKPPKLSIPMLAFGAAAISPGLSWTHYCIVCRKYFFPEALQDRAVGRGACTWLNACAAAPARGLAPALSPPTPLPPGRACSAGVRIGLKDDILLMGRMGRGREKHGLDHPCPCVTNLADLMDFLFPKKLDFPSPRMYYFSKSDWRTSSFLAWRKGD
jgi:hypothetical protein